MISPWLFDKLIKIAVIMGCIWLVGTAWKVEPDSRGYGSHEQLGLEACGYLRACGHPCPTCGMTTAFANTVRFRLVPAWRANPAGMLLCLLVMVLPGALIHSMVTGQPLARFFVGRWSGYWIVLGLLIWGLSWAWKIHVYTPA